MRIPHPELIVLAVFYAAIVGHLAREQSKHFRNLGTFHDIVMVNGSRGKSSVTRLIWGVFSADQARHVVGKTTGTAAMFIYPGGTERPITRKNNIVNVIEQIDVVDRAARLGATSLIVECMAVDPDLQELNQKKLIRSRIGVITNVRDDHLDEMGGENRNTEGVARSLCRGMPAGGICITAETEHLDILQEEADKRGTRLIVATADMVSDAEMSHFQWITFPENVAIGLVIAELVGISREDALRGMYAAPPDPGVLRIDPCQHNGVRFQAVNLAAANDPTSTVMNMNLLRDRGKISAGVSVVINCRPDRIERNGQMGGIVTKLGADRVFLIGSPTKSAADHIPADMRDRVIDLGGEVITGGDLLEAITDHVPAGEHDHAVVLVGNIHGAGHDLLHEFENARYDGPTVDQELDAIIDQGERDMAHTRMLEDGNPGKTLIWPRGATMELPVYGPQPPGDPLTDRT